MIAATRVLKRHAWVTGPLGEKANASWGISGDGKTAFIEMAAASGLELVPAEKRDPLVTTTRHRRVNPAGAGERRDKHYYRHWR